MALPQVWDMDVLDPGIQLPPQVFQALFNSRSKPLVIKDQLNSWSKSGFWEPGQICKTLGSKMTTFKISPKRDTPAFHRHFRGKDVVFETQCDYIETTFHNFLEWLNSSPVSTSCGEPSETEPPQCKRIKVDQPQNGDNRTENNSQSSTRSDSALASASSTCEQPSVKTSNPLLNYPKTDYWIYADYKYMIELCSDMPDMLTSIDWSVIGYAGRDGKDSTLWIGSEGANTPCHFDTYGCNFVAQLHGTKKWTLFDPRDLDKLYPTRVPYEESSVFSRVNITDPDLTKHPSFSKAKAYEVTLVPGDLLYVPRHWWHYVESVGEDPTVSVNTWVEVPEDANERMKEAIVRAIVSVFAINQDESETSQWINPNETLFSTDENMVLLSKVLKDFKDQQNQPFVADTSLTTADFLQTLTTPTVVDSIAEVLTTHS